MFGPLGVFVQHVEQRLAFRIGPAFDANGEARIDVERFAAADRMTDYQGMNRILDGGIRISNPAADIVFLVLEARRVATKDMAAGMHRAQSVQRLLQAARQGFIGAVHAGKDRIPAPNRGFAGQ